jgi:hypothetical protein
MTLEDAKLYKQDVYALIVDFTSAFNTTDHDKLLIILFDLEFPTDAIDVVKTCTIKHTLESGCPWAAREKSQLCQIKLRSLQSIRLSTSTDTPLI